MICRVIRALAFLRVVRGLGGCYELPDDDEFE
jgi:hypothetical protein